MADFLLRFPESDLRHWADRYSYADDSAITDGIAPAVKARGWFTREEFEALCDWKSHRIKSRVRRNPTERITTATRIALEVSDPRIKIGVLRTLEGVDWATASVMLHFCDRTPYPVLDFRALWSVGMDRVPSYSYGFWERYAAFVTGLADRTGEPMRTVDRALWQFSKEHQ